MSRPQAEELSNCATTSELATRLLELQQRVAAFNSLYEEEVSALEQELTRLKVDFVRYYHAQVAGSPSVKAKRPRRAGRRSTAPRPAPEQPPDESSAQKE
jgi:hypothetical protein